MICVRRKWQCRPSRRCLVLVPGDDRHLFPWPQDQRHPSERPPNGSHPACEGHDRRPTRRRGPKSILGRGATRSVDPRRRSRHRTGPTPSMPRTDDPRGQPRPKARRAWFAPDLTTQIRGGHGGAVPPGGDHPQDRVPVARQTGWSAAIATGRGQSLEPVPSLLERRRTADLVDTLPRWLVRQPTARLHLKLTSHLPGSPGALTARSLLCTGRRCRRPRSQRGTPRRPPRSSALLRARRQPRPQG